MSQPNQSMSGNYREPPDSLVGNVKVTKANWLNLARDILVQEGVAEIKILSLSARLNVSRSSFYWYFQNRADLLSDLLEEWELRNTKTIENHCALPAENINEAACNFFRCFVDPKLFDRGLDFAVREWARRDAKVHELIEVADQKRLFAVKEMFQRHNYSAEESDIRARIIYFMQIGYHAVEMNETMQLRMSRLEGFLAGFTGIEPDPQLIEEFTAFALSKAQDREENESE